MGQNAYQRLFTPPVTIFDYAELILGVEEIEQT